MANIIIDDKPKFDWSKDYGDASQEEIDDAKEAMRELGLDIPEPVQKWVSISGQPVLIHVDKHMLGRHDQESHGNRGGYLSEQAVREAAAAGPKGAGEGGFTYNPIRLKNRATPTSGIGVSVLDKKDEYRILLSNPRNIQRELLKNYVRDHREQIKKPGNYLGGWIEHGELVLDISEVIQNRDEAIKIGKQRRQTALYDFGKKELVFL